MVKIFNIDNNFNININDNIACIGYFDGIHLGHKQLILKTMEEANKLNFKSTVICFKNDSNTTISGKTNKYILSFEDRINKFKEYGIDQVIVIRFNNEFMKISPEDFIKDYLNKFNLKKLICGFDYSFGYMAKGNCELLKKEGNFETIVIEEKKYYGKKISSTRIKDALNKGNFRLVDKLLGYEYQLVLNVDNCLQNKNKWLIEASLYDKNCILPKDGKYNSFEINNGKIYIQNTNKIQIGSKFKLGINDGRIIL